MPPTQATISGEAVCPCQLAELALEPSRLFRTTDTTEHFCAYIRRSRTRHPVYRDGLGKKNKPTDPLRASHADGARGTIEIDADEAMTRNAIALLQTGDPAAYSEALVVVREDTALWWEDVVSDDEQTHPDGQPRDGQDYRPHSRTAASLLRFLTDDVMPTYAKSRAELARRPSIRLQAHGESLDPFRFERILALDERLTRQIQRTLAMIMRMQGIRTAPCGALDQS